MSKVYTISLKGKRAVECVVKAAMGQNTSEGVHDLDDRYYHLGSDRWYAMAQNELLVLNERDLEDAILCFSSLGEAAEDNSGAHDYDGANNRAKAKAFARLVSALRKAKEEAR